MYQYHSVSPTHPSLIPDMAKRVATTRPCGFDLGPCTEEELDIQAASALNAGYDVWIAVYPRPKYRDEVADLYVLQQAV